MKVSKSIAFVKLGGEIQDKENLFLEIENAIKLLSNYEYTLTIKKRTSKRSINQNAIMWAWLKCVENETGQAKEDVHDHYCKLFLKREITINGKNEVVVGGTRSLSTVEMADFLKKVQVDVAVEFGIILPIPEDKAFEDFMNNY